jgi:hypothetical protein
MIRMPDSRADGTFPNQISFAQALAAKEWTGILAPHLGSHLSHLHKLSCLVTGTRSRLTTMTADKEADQPDLLSSPVELHLRILQYISYGPAIGFLQIDQDFQNVVAPTTLPQNVKASFVRHAEHWMKHNQRKSASTRTRHDGWYGHV